MTIPAPRTALKTFSDVADLPEHEIDLAEAALLLAREEYPDLDVEAYRVRLDRLAEGARPRLAEPNGNPFAVIDALNTYLFHGLGFSGNRDDYFDPRNSYLNDVLDRRRGIPITLSIVYMEIAARLGFPLEGVGFPGHFLVRHAAGDRSILIDPFHAGQILLPDDCRQRLKAATGSDMPLEPRFFLTAGKKQILARMLNNLKNIHMKSGDSPRSLKAIEMLLPLSPHDPFLLRDRGFVHFKLDHFGRALKDLEAYLHLEPAAPDADDVRKQIRNIHRLTATLN
jgi:regulator of sirC expression with transglutaminase-like and TPR domain